MEILTLEDVHSYHELQTQLSSAVIEQANRPLDKDIVFSLPSSGSVLIKNERWLYNKHGMGISFRNKNSGIIVDIDDEVAKPQLIKVYRLVQYIRSKNKTNVEFNAMKIALERLISIDKKIIKKLPGEHYEISK